MLTGAKHFDDVGVSADVSHGFKFLLEEDHLYLFDYQVDSPSASFPAINTWNLLAIPFLSMYSRPSSVP